MVVWKRASLVIQVSRVQTRLRSMDFFSGFKNPEGLSAVGVGHGGLGVTCSPRDPKFASSNPVEVDGFFHDVKILREWL